MQNPHEITTKRLFLTPFAPEHADALHAMEADPDLMRHLGGTRSREETEAAIARVQARWQSLGHGWWTVFLRDTGTVIGAACLQHLAHQPDAPLEIGWRLMPAYRGKGYATEAGQAAMDFAFHRLGVTYLCAVAALENRASQRVMQRLGMTDAGQRTYYDAPCVYFEKRRPA